MEQTHEVLWYGAASDKQTGNKTLICKCKIKFTGASWQEVGVKFDSHLAGAATQSHSKNAAGTLWISYGKTWREFRKEGLAIPGTEIRWRSQRIELIGDLSTEGGQCSCCLHSQAASEIVEAYRVWPRPED